LSAAPQEKDSVGSPRFHSPQPQNGVLIPANDEIARSALSERQSTMVVAGVGLPGHRYGGDAAVHESGYGPTRTCRFVRAMSVHRGEAEVTDDLLKV
jgi:hypothetical protein